MSFKQVAIGGLLLAGFGFACISFATFGDYGVGYTIENETSRVLLTWRLDRNCSVLIGHRGDYGHVKEVPPHEVIEIGYVTGPQDSDGCIQVSTEDRRIIKVQAYEEGAQVTVAEPLTFLTERVPPEDELPKGRWFGWVNAPWPLTLGVSAMVLGLGVALVGGVGLGLRWLSKNRQREAISEETGP